MNKLFKIFALAFITFLPTLLNAQVKEYFGAIPDLKVSGKEFVDPTGKAVTLHGVMDTPNAYFNGARWVPSKKHWDVDYSDQWLTPCKEYFTNVFQAIANPAKGTYCNLFRLHLDPAWTNDPSKKPTNGGGENDISRFSASLLRKHMEDLYVPIVKDALAHGLYVIMRPPGVFPEDVEVGDAYNEYLFTVWDIVSSDEYVKSHAGQIMLELGNEPVRMKGNLADYFQPIVNKIRSNGFTGILLLPGTGWQANYTNYETKAIKDDNFGYAVHNYPGWYGGWDANQTEANFISTFEAQVPVDQKPIVITEVDWSPMKEGAGHWNEAQTQYTEGNFGTWGTGTTNSPAPNVDYKNTQNVGWGMRFKHLVDKHPNISWTLQGTTTFVDMDAYLRDGTVKPAFTDAMKAAGYADASEACSGSCFSWYYQYACGNRIPYGTPSVAPEVVPHSTTAETIGSAKFDSSNGHYCFYTPSYSSFVFKNWKGTQLDKCSDFIIDLGDESTIGYRLDVQLIDASGNIIKDGDQNYIIGTEGKGTRLTSPADMVFDMQILFKDFLGKGVTVGEIRLNTVVDWGKEDSDKTGKYFFTIDQMEMVTSVVSARKTEPYTETSLKDLKVKTMTTNNNYVVNNPSNLGGWGATSITYKDGVGKDGAGYMLVNDTKREYIYSSQFNIEFPTALTPGVEYTLSLDIKGTVAGSIGAAIQNPDGYKDCGNFPAIDITTDWAHVIKTTTVTGEGAVRVLLNFGYYVGTIYIDNIQLYTSGEPIFADARADQYETHFGTEISNGGVVFGTSTVSHDIFADLTGFNKMRIIGSGQEARVMFNRLVPDGDLVEKKVSLTNGSAEIDLTNIDNRGFVRLHSIKAQWEQTINVTDIILQTNGNPDEIANYYISGKGVLETTVNEALSDETATVIDLTGYTGNKEISFSSANPNCLLIYKEGNQVGSAYDSRNLVKNDPWGYSAWTIALQDGYDFRSPIDITTVAQKYSDESYSVSYTRNFSESGRWATITLPFQLNVESLGLTEVYLVDSFSDETAGATINLNKVESGTIAAGTTILYRNKDSNTVTLRGQNIAKTAEGYNIQPIDGMDDWFAAQNYTYRVIEDVTIDPVLKDYDVYFIQDNTFYRATKRLTLAAFRSIFLHRKSSQLAPARLSIRSSDEETNGIQQTISEQSVTECERYDAAGRMITSPVRGLNIVRMNDGSVKRLLIK